MEPADTLALERRARRAYETARLRRALARSPRLLPVVGVMFVSCQLPAVAGLAALLLVLAAVGLWWRGQAYGRAVAPGIGAGLVPLGATFFATVLSHAGAALACWQVCVGLCAGAGLLAGLVVGWAAEREPDPRAFLLSAVSLAALVGVPGCAFAGGAGVMGMLVALLLVSMRAAWHVSAARPGSSPW